VRAGAAVQGDDGGGVRGGGSCEPAGLFAGAAAAGLGQDEEAARRARHQFGQSLVDEYRRRHPGTVEEETAPRTVIGDLLRERSPESHDDVVIRTVCLVSQYISAYRGSMHATHAVVPARNAWPMCPAVATTC
jgi:hypothetical protein